MPPFREISIVKNPFAAAAIILLCAACQTATTSISESRAEASIRKFCPAFRSGPFAVDGARTYGTEQITTFKNASTFHCRCIARSAEQEPKCSQVRRFTLGNIEEG